MEKRGGISLGISIEIGKCKKGAHLYTPPVAITCKGSTSGAVVANFLIIILTKADCAAETLKAPPITWKTRGSIVSLFSPNKIEKACLQKMMAVTDDMSSGAAFAWATLIGIWKGKIKAKPQMI